MSDILFSLWIDKLNQAPTVVWILFGGGMTLGLVIVFFDRVEIVVAKLYSWLSPLKRSFDKAAALRDVQNRLYMALRRLDGMVRRHLPGKVKLKATDQKRSYGILEDGQVMVMLHDRHNDQPRNLAVATMIYVEMGLVHMARPYVDATVLRCSDLLMASKLLQSESSAARTFFITHFLQPAMKSPEVELWYHKLLQMDRQGIFGTVWLRELGELGTRLYPKAPTRIIADESVHFGSFLFQFASRRRGSPRTPTLFTGRVLKVGLVLCARRETVDRRGREPYVEWVLDHFKHGATTVYLLAAGRKTNMLGDIADDVQSRVGALIERETAEDRMTFGDQMGSTKSKLLRIQCIGGRREHLFSHEQAGDDRIR